jgi:hypothetical protein
VLVHLRFDPRIPGARERTEKRAERLSTAIKTRYASLLNQGSLEVRAVVRAGDSGTLYAVESSPKRRDEFSPGLHA